MPVLVYLALWTLVVYSLAAAGCRGERPAMPLLGVAVRPAAAAGPVAAAGSQVATASQPAKASRVGAGPQAADPQLAAGSGWAEVLVESSRFALPPSAAGNRFDSGWARRELQGREALVPESGSGRLLSVNLGEEVPRTLTLDLSREGLPEGGRLSVRVGDREVAQAILRAAALPLALRLPDDLPVGLVPLDLVFGPPSEASKGGVGPAAGLEGKAGAGAPQGQALGAGPPARRGLPAVPAVFGASLSPALPAGGARVEGADVVMGGNCLVYLHCRLAGMEALEGTFVPPADARAGQRFELSVERLDGTPIRRFGWRPSFWNRLRGARRFQLPLRGTRGPVRVRLIARAGDAGGPPARWQALGLVDVTGEILTPGQGQ